MIFVLDLEQSTMKCLLNLNWVLNLREMICEMDTNEVALYHR